MGRGEAPLSDVWERRLRRAEQLGKEWPHAAEILQFFRGWTALLRRHVEGGPLQAVAVLRDFLDFIGREGPADLRGDAGGLGPDPRLLEDEAQSGRPAAALALQALGQVLRMRGEMPKAGEDRGCPRCFAPPLVGALREDREAETVRRTLVCSGCLVEWDFPRVLCPGCKEERPEKLPRFTAEEIPWIRVEACDSCGKYLKAVDLSKEPRAEPVVDELGSTPLDLLARERGYAKIAPNLAGL